MNPKYVILCISYLLLLIPIAGATYDVVSGIASNSTEYTTSASYGELHNISLATGEGIVFIKASWDARMNFTAPLYGRFVRDGVSLGRFNLTQSVYAQVGSYEIAFNETTGTHYYGFEVYSNRRGTIYSRNFSAIFLKNGTFGTLNSNYNATYDAKEPAISSSIANKFYGWDKTFKDILISYISGLQEKLDAMNASSASNNTASQGRDDFINMSVAALQINAPNTTVAGNLNNWNSTYNASYAKGGVSFSIENGTNIIGSNYNNSFTTVYAGTITKLIAHSTQTGNINVSFWNASNGDSYIGSVAIATGTDANTILNYAFGDETRIMFNVTSVTGIKQVALTVKTTRRGSS